MGTGVEPSVGNHSASQHWERAFGERDLRNMARRLAGCRAFLFPEHLRLLVVTPCNYLILFGASAFRR